VVKCMTCGRENMESKMKSCSKCLEEKPLENFSINRSNPDGHEYSCKDCMKKRGQNYRDLKRDKKKVPAATARRRGESTPAKAGRWAGKPSPTITRATPEQIIADLRRGLAIEIIDMIQEKFGL